MCCPFVHICSLIFFLNCAFTIQTSFEPPPPKKNVYAHYFINTTDYFSISTQASQGNTEIEQLSLWSHMTLIIYASQLGKRKHAAVCLTVRPALRTEAL